MAIRAWQWPRLAVAAIASCPGTAHAQSRLSGFLGITMGSRCSQALPASPRRPRCRPLPHPPGWPARHIPGRATTCALRDPCHTYHVPGQNPAPAPAERLAQELGECRQRGVEGLDINTHNQHAVPLPELQRLAAEYAQATLSTSRGRIAQIKRLLRDGLHGMEADNSDEAQLIRDLLFGGDEHTVTKSAGELLEAAKRKYHEPNEARFRARRNRAFTAFAEFIFEFVAKAQAQAADATVSTPVQRALPLRANAHPYEGRLWLSPLEAVFRFSLEDPGRTGNLTIEAHQNLIARHGSCWWGWFKAAHDMDHSAAISQRLVDCDVALWDRTSDLFYIAKCERASVNGGAPIPSPEPELTPDYYRSSRWPAWLRLSSIREANQQEVAERFGDLPNTQSTIYWSPEPPQEPLTVPAQGNSILHLADLHFGKYHRWNTSHAQRRSSMTTEQAITRTLHLQDIDLLSIGVIVVCGNFCSDEPTSESYEEAVSFIDGLCEQLPNVTRDHFVIVPGADDFVRPGDRERAVQTLYRQFHQNLYGGPDLDIGRMRQYEFSDLLINVLPINSVKMLGTEQRDEGVFGHGYDSQLNTMLRDYLRSRGGGSQVVNVVAAHHHLVPATPKLPADVPQESVRARLMPGIHDAREALAKLNASRVTLFLHGHLHETDLHIFSSDDGWQTALCSAGTAGAAGWWLRSKYRDNHANSLALYNIENRGIHGRMFVFDEDFRRASPVRSFDIPVGLALPTTA